MFTYLSFERLTPWLTGSAALFSILNFAPVALSQTSHADHHHLMVGRDGLGTLTSGMYGGLPNPNYNRLTLLFPHQHEPINTSHFHAIGVYSYTGSPTNPTINSTSGNNQIPEARYNLPPLPLFPGTGIFSGQWVTAKTEDHMYSDLKTRPVAHLTDDLDDPYVQAIYNTGNGRWQGLLGDEAIIALELVDITPGLGIANPQGQPLFNGVGDTYIIGQGDYFSFTPIFYVSDNAPVQNYAATLRFLDINTNNRTPWLSSGTFTLNVQQTMIPESSSVIAMGIMGSVLLLHRKYQQR